MKNNIAQYTGGSLDLAAYFRNTSGSSTVIRRCSKCKGKVSYSPQLGFYCDKLGHEGITVEIVVCGVDKDINNQT